MTFFFSKSTNCLQQCRKQFNYSNTVMKSLLLFLAKQTSSFLAVIPLRIYDLILTVKVEELENLNGIIYKSGLLTKSLVLLDIEGIKTHQILADGLRKELYLDIQAVYDRFEQSTQNLIEAIDFLDSELTAIRTKFCLVVNHLTISAAEIFDDTLESLIKWSIGTCLQLYLTVFYRYIPS